MGMNFKKKPDTRLILLNGGKDCGKSELVKHLMKTLPEHNWVERRCKDKLFELTASLFNLTLDDFMLIYEDKALKELPLSTFTISRRQYLRLCEAKKVESQATEGSVAISVRDALIFVSEVLCKPSFGPAYFGKARANAIQVGEIAIDDSAGFNLEVAPSLEKLGENNILIIRIYGRGNFDNDSREYLSDGHCYNTIDVFNDGTEQDFKDNVTKIIEDFLAGESIFGLVNYEEDYNGNEESED